MCARLRSRLYTRVLETFDSQASLGKISKARLAKRLGKRPEQITRWLSGPNNFNADTVAMLLFGMGAELDPQVVSMEGRKPNYRHPLATRITPGTIQVRPTSTQNVKVTTSSTATTALKTLAPVG